MKVKLTFKAINDKVESDKEKAEYGKVISSEEVNDALQITNFDGIRIAVTDFGKNLANALIMQQLPDTVKDVIGYRHELEGMHGNGGKPFEISEEYMPLLKDMVKKVYPTITYAAFVDLIEKCTKKKSK